MKSQRRLALVWGRKFFFSYGLLSLLGLGLLLFQHINKPESISSWIYLITTYLGHFGLVITLGYFAIYTPLVWISSGYYWSRFWASSIITACVGILGFDVMVVSQYRWHFYELMTMKPGLTIEDLLGATGLSSILYGSLFALWIFLFVIGEKWWRHLQRRFSQTVSNWYLVPILGCFVISNIMHMVADYNKNRDLLAYEGVLSFQSTLTAKKLFAKLGFDQKEVVAIDNKNQSFFYPKDQLQCENKEPKNLLVLLVPNWGAEEFNNSETETFRHYASHGQSFNQNYIGTSDNKEGIFSFFYGLPSFYLKGFLQEKNEAVVFDILKKLNVETSVLSTIPDANFLNEQVSYEKLDSNIALVEKLKEKISNEEGAKIFAHFAILQHTNSIELENSVKSIIEDLVSKKLTKKTNVIVASISSNEKTAPLFTLFPNREDTVIPHFTQLIDVVPSLMKDQYKCKNKFTDYSLGQNLWETQKKSIVFSGLKDNLSILSFDTDSKTLIDLEGQDYLKELKSLTLFYKRTR